MISICGRVRAWVRNRVGKFWCLRQQQ